MPTMTESGRRVFKTIEEKPMEIDKKERTIVHKITASTVDRDMEVLLTKGLNFKYLRDTKSVLFNHDAYEIIAKNVWVRQYDDHVRAKTQFAETERGKEMFYLASEDYVNAWSVGMDWTTMKYCDAKEREAHVRLHPEWSKAARILKEADVIEYSLVPVGSCRDALTQCLRDGKVTACKSMLERFLSETVDEPKTEAQTVKRIEPVIRRIPVTEPMIRKIADKELRLMRGYD